MPEVDHGPVPVRRLVGLKQKPKVVNRVVMIAFHNLHFELRVIFCSTFWIDRFTIPEKDDEVLVAFLHGDFQHAIILGALHNGVDTPPYANEDGENNLRVFQSRSGHRLTFDDSPGDERVELILHNEEIRVIWDSANKVIGVYSGKDIIIETEETFSLKCTDFILEASENIDIQSGVSTTLVSGVETSVDGGSEMTLQAGMLKIN